MFARAKKIVSTRRKLQRASGRMFEPLEGRTLFSAGSLIVPLLDPIQIKRAANPFLGASTSHELPTTYNGGTYETYQHGMIIYSPSTGAHTLYGAIETKWFTIANDKDFFGRPVQKVIGLPISDEGSSSITAGALTLKFQGGVIDSDSATGTHDIYGAIYSKYQTLDSEKDYFGRNVLDVLGMPTTDEQNVSYIAGARENLFQGGAVLWEDNSIGAHVIYGAIYTKYNAVNAQTDPFGHNVRTVLGMPTTDEQNVSYITGARESLFQGGAILWEDNSIGAHVIYGAIYTKYNALNAETDPFGHNVRTVLGMPITDEQNVSYITGARESLFQGGAILWEDNSIGAHVIYGAIYTKYEALAGETDPFGHNLQVVLGMPITDEQNVSYIAGARESLFQGGAILWEDNSIGAHVIYGAIYTKYNALNGETDPYGRNVRTLLGMPTTDEQNVSYITGARESLFQGGAILWEDNSIGAHVIYGAIYSEYNATNAETDAYGRNVRTLLGMPTTDEQNAPNTTDGRENIFQGGGILWSSTTGAHVVYGAIWDEYLHSASLTNAYGETVQKIIALPTADEKNYDGGRRSTFQGGSIIWSAAHGAFVEYGAIGALYNSLGGPASSLGWQTSNEFADTFYGPQGRVVDYVNGFIWWNPTSGAHAV